MHKDLGVCVIMCYYVHKSVSVGTSVCVKIIILTVPATCIPASACLRECMYLLERHSHILAISTEKLKQKLKGGVVNTVTLSAEQPVCIILCGKQLRQTRDF